MENTDREKFDSLWNDFIALVKGKLINSASKQKLSVPLANLILSDAASTWTSEYEINGKWLYGFAEREPQKADLIREILMNDMKFGDVEMRRELSNGIYYIVPAIGAIAGLSISYFSGASKVIQAISTIAPAILLYPAVKLFGKQQAETNVQKNIEDIMQQLEKYHNSILSILS